LSGKQTTTHLDAGCSTLTCSLRSSTAKSARPKVAVAATLGIVPPPPVRTVSAPGWTWPPAGRTWHLRLTLSRARPFLAPIPIDPDCQYTMPESAHAPDHALHVTSESLPRRHRHRTPPTQRRNSHAAVQPAAGANNPNASLQRTGADQISGTKKGDRSRPFSGLTELSSVFPFAHGADHQWWSARKLQLPACAFP
jgi:hypothetical protein